jgi:glycerophosphoryl diester phosphodiesterase
MTSLLTHRGLDPDRAPYFPESSREAFTDQLKRGFGLEFDVRIAQDGVPLVLHDETATRVSDGQNTRAIADILSENLLRESWGAHTLTLREMVTLIVAEQKADVFSALHLKKTVQDSASLDSILENIALLPSERCIIFDVVPAVAALLHQKRSDLRFAASVAHPYDIKRYGAVTGHTLLTLEEAILHRSLYTWVWLDEWDLEDANGTEKKLYTTEVFAAARAAGFGIALVTPELHSTSPALLGGEAHPDAGNPIRLQKRLKEITRLNPDAICTDHPDLVRSLL